MKKSLLCLIGLFIFISFSEAQKVKLKDLDVKANILNFPDKGFPQGVTTYFVDIHTKESALQRLGYTKTDLSNFVDIKGYTKIKENIGAGVYLTIEGPSGTPVKLQTDKKKNKEGKTWSEYSYYVTFSGSIRRKVVDESGATIHEDISSYSEVEQTGKYISSSELKKKFNSEKFYISGRKKALVSLIDNTSRKLSRDFSYTPKKKKVEFKRLNSKKHPKYATFKATEEVTKAAFEAMTPYDNSKFKELIAPALETWVAEEPALSGKDKHPKKLKFLCQLNASLAYMYSEDYENALLYANMIKNGDEKKKKGKKLVEEITKIQENVKRLGLETRFFKIEVDESVAVEIEKAQEERKDAIASGDIRAFPDFDEKLDVSRESTVVKGTSVSISGHETNGYWVYNSNYFDGPDFRDPSRIRFGYLKEGEIAVGTPNFSKLSKVTIGEKEYTMGDVKVGSGLTGLKIKNAVIEVLNDYNKTSIVRIFPSFKKGRAYGQTNDTEAAVVVYHKGKEKYMNIRGLKSRAKTVGNIVKDCESAKELAKVEFKSKGGLLSKIGSQSDDNIPALVKVLEAYDNCE